MQGVGFVIAGRLALGNAIVTRAGPPVTLAKIDWKQGKSPVAVYNFEVEEDHTYFVGSANGGLWVHNPGSCYRQNFLNANPHIDPSEVSQVHHAIPQVVTKNSPGMFTDAEIHSVDNLRGIPVGGERGHQQITNAWRRFFNENKDATRSEIEKFRDAIDKAINQHFIH